MRSTALLLAITVAFGCSDSTVPPAEDSGAGTRSVPVPSACVSEAGYQVCEGINGCPSDASCSCNVNCPCIFANGSGPSVCLNGAFHSFQDANRIACWDCETGNLCVAFAGGPLATALTCAPLELGLLLIKNGGEELVRYEDYALWSGEMIPP